MKRGYERGRARRGLVSFPEVCPMSRYRLKIEGGTVSVHLGQACYSLPGCVALALCDLLPPARAELRAAERARLAAAAGRAAAELERIRADLAALEG